MRRTKNQSNTMPERKVGYFQKDPSVTTIYIGNLRYTKTEMDIKKMFEKYGKVAWVKLIIDPETEQSKGYAFVQMPKKDQATAAIASYNGTEIDGRTLKVSISNERVNNIYNPKKESTSKIKNMNSKNEEEIIQPKRRRDKGLKVLFNYLDA